MIRAVAFVPATAVLLPAVSGTGFADLVDVARACRTAIGRALNGADAVLLLGPHDDPGHRPRIFDGASRGSLRGLGPDVALTLDGRSADTGRTAEVPVALTVAAALLHETGHGSRPVTALAVGSRLGPEDAAVDQLDQLDQLGRVALIVAGDGTARRGVKAPGYLDDRAAGYDARVSAALCSGEPAALSGLDDTLGAELLAAGVPAWRAAGELLARQASGPWRAELLAEQDPFGVAYLVAVWTSTGRTSGG